MNAKKTELSTEATRLRAEIDALKQLPAAASVDLGDRLARARAAWEAIKTSDILAVFPDSLTAVSGAALLDFEQLASLSAWQLEPLEPLVIELHAYALAGGYEDLAVILRSPRARARVVMRARSANAGDPEGAARAERRALETYYRGIGEQLAGAGQLLPASREIATVLPALDAELTLLAQQHDAAIAAAAQRELEEARAAEEAERAARRAADEARWAEQLRHEKLNDRAALDRRETLAEFYRRHARFTFMVDGVQIDGDVAAENLAKGADILPYVKAQSSGVPRRAAEAVRR